MKVRLGCASHEEEKNLRKKNIIGVGVRVSVGVVIWSLRRCVSIYRYLRYQILPVATV